LEEEQKHEYANDDDDGDAQQSDYWQYKNYGFVEMQHVRFALLSLFKQVLFVGVLTCIAIPYAVGFYMITVLRWDGGTIFFLIHVGVIVLFILLWELFLKEFNEAINELGAVEKHISFVNDVNRRM